ncbi:TraB/GumN family protein [Acidovorax sp. SUPP3334]|uniref:TraB/GumN family protein n=1 Tax=Acidovorax sp. SUPP3334 TaxID=2920881 RepID=UPI0023DE37D8|nr:TraB/GumN family protein [Acidovorax sp. SUPP3334]GKT24232.1 TraB/GumN family protein [Acidovorax sp. SUPP3334]
MTTRAGLVRLALAAWLAWPLAVAAQELAQIPAAPPAPSASAPEASATRACPPQAAPFDPAELPQAMRNARDRGLLWRIEKGGRTSWLYGTVHAAERGWMFPGPTVREAVMAADRVALELDLLDPKVMQALQAAMVAPPGAPALPPALAARLAAQVDAACLAPAVAHLRPELQAVTLVGQSARRSGVDLAYGIDAVIAGMAKAGGKPVVALETPEQQIRLLTSDDPARTAAAVGAALDQLEGGQAQRSITTLTRAWANGRLNVLQTYPQWCECLASDAEQAEYRQMVDARNPGMARGIAAEHAAGHTVFAAVGALHMVGPQGLPALMEKQGFRVQRVAFAPAAPEGAAPRSPANDLKQKEAPAQ